MKQTRLGGKHLIAPHLWESFSADRADLLSAAITALIHKYRDAGGQIEEFTIEVSPDRDFPWGTAIVVGLYGYQEKADDENNG